MLDDAGVVTLPLGRPTMVRYRVGLARAPGVAVTSPILALDPELDLDPGGVTPRISELASEVMGEGSDLERARRAQAHLIGSYEYTTDLMGTPEGERVETFLFSMRRGHCELFASSMVLMLRAEGIPARLATGFLGADYNPIEGYYIVRQSNAHAWVEAYIDGPGGVGGWRVFDPTPPAGRPAVGESGLSELASQLYDYLIFRWDRYILTYGLADQVGFVASLNQIWKTVTGWFGDGEDSAAKPMQPSAPAVAPAVLEPEPPVMKPAAWGSLTGVLLLASVGFFWYQRQRFSATLAYLRLRERLRPEFGPQLEAVPPLTVADRFADRFPRTAQPARELVELYLGESFDGRRLSPAQLRRARDLLRRALQQQAA